MEKHYPLPSKDRQEWRDLLNGTINVPLKNYFFQMKVTQARNQIKTGKFSLEEEVDNIYALCKKFIKAKNMDTDLANIFGDYLQEAPTQENKQQPIAKFKHDDRQYIMEEAEKQKKLDTERKKRAIIEQIRKQEERAKQEAEKGRLEAERIRLEAEKAIKERLALERQKKAIEKTESHNLNKKELISQEKKQAEMQRLKAIKNKKRKVVKKKSFFGSFIDNFFRN